MAKLKAPLLSLGASGQIGKSLVYFPWKGLDLAREYVVPSNPKSTAQGIQRGFMIACVAAIHAAQILATNWFKEPDKIAFAAWGSIFPTPRTWFNQVVKNWIDQRVAGLRSAIYHDVTVVAQDGAIWIRWWFTADGVNNITEGYIYYGTSKTALVNRVVASVGDGDRVDNIVDGLTNGTKYYFQFRPTVHADFVGSRSGISHGTPHA